MASSRNFCISENFPLYGMVLTCISKYALKSRMRLKPEPTVIYFRSGIENVWLCESKQNVAVDYQSDTGYITYYSHFLVGLLS